MPDYPLPKWRTDVTKTKQFQDWVNGMYPGTIKTKGGVGVFGPQTTAAWNKHGNTYQRIYDNLHLDPGQKRTTAQESVPIKKVTERPFVQIVDDRPQLTGKSATIGMGAYRTETDGTTTEEIKPNFMGKVTKAMSGMGKLVPYLSNMRNAMTKPPMPQRSQPYSYTSLQKVDLSDEKAGISRIYSAGNKSAERTVDGNTAEAIKAFNRGEEISKLSSVNEREQNTNTQIQNTQAQMDANVSAANTGLENEFRTRMLERNIAHTTAQSENFANAADKYVAIQNEEKKRTTELDKANVLKGLYEKSGVLKRQGEEWRKSGIPDPMGMDYKWLGTEIKAAGGILAGLASIKVPLRKILH